MNKFSSLLFLSSLPSLTFAKGLRASAAEQLKSLVQQSSQSYSATRALTVSISQLGDDIEGENNYDFSGSSLALSANGKYLVVGANGASGTRGNVRTFKFDDASESWLQQGQTLEGEGGGDESGTSVTMSHDGMTIAVGAPQNNNFRGHARAYGFNISSQSWIQLGQDIDGGAVNGAAGSSVALSGDGNRLAIGSPEESTLTGSVKVFEFVGDAWAQLGAAIIGNDYYSTLGNSVALSENGSRVVVGSRNDKENGDSFVGAVSVFEYLVDEWARLGNELSGEAYFDHFGDSVDISGDGDRIVVGAPNKEDGDLVNVGSAEVYQYDAIDDAWNLLGNAIKGSIALEQLGTSVSMSQDGNRIVVGSEHSDENGTDSGKTWIFQYDPLANEWMQLGANIFGDAYDRAGRAVAMSADGDHIAIGAPLNNYYTGHSKVFEIVGGESSCADSERLLSVEVTTDVNGDTDNFFKVMEYESETGLFSKRAWVEPEMESSTTQVFEKCLPVNSCYRVSMRDIAGDGMGGGSFKVTWDGTLVKEETNFVDGKGTKSPKFGGACDFN